MDRRRPRLVARWKENRIHAPQRDRQSDQFRDRRDLRDERGWDGTHAPDLQRGRRTWPVVVPGRNAHRVLLPEGCGRAPLRDLRDERGWLPANAFDGQRRGGPDTHFFSRWQEDSVP